ncbi:mitochondrial thiamine pyrophosphate carrier-like isoform X1 [Zophobas morio]|uniref:mitochondrial thiamine pyrophosphate carrier-like isoform X1 n=2 Tax=Zophobas morio TaxID=2755281 RepID=UPI003082946F
MVGYSKYRQRKLTQLDYLIAGAGSGVITRMITQPLDVLKIRFQLQVEPILRSSSSKYHSVFHATKLIIQEEGVKALWKGHIPAQFLSVSYGTVQFWSFEVLTEKAATFDLSPSFYPVINFTCGAVAGCTATAASFPFDVVRTRLVAQSEHQKVYSSVTQAFTTIVRNEGFFALYRGMLPTFFQIAPHGGVQFMCYRLFNNFYKYLTDTTDTTFVSSFLSGSFAGFCGKTAVYPLDLAKKRMQIQGFEHGRSSFGAFFKCSGLYDCLVKIYEVEGFSGLFKGLSPSILKAVFTTALYFSTYETICKLLASQREDD